MAAKKRIGNFKRSKIEFIINFSSIFSADFVEIVSVSFSLMSPVMEHSFIMDLIVHNNYTLRYVLPLTRGPLTHTRRSLSNRKWRKLSEMIRFWGSLTRTFSVEASRLQLEKKLYNRNFSPLQIPHKWTDKFHNLINVAFVFKYHRKSFFCALVVRKIQINKKAIFMNTTLCDTCALKSTQYQL